MFVLEALESRGTIKSRKSTTVEYSRVPSVFPVLTADNTGDELAKLSEPLRKHLRKAGVQKERSQPLWVMPKETFWGTVFQMACYEETGYFPYVVQRWRLGEDGNLVRGDVRLIDGHGMMGFKDANG